MDIISELLDSLFPGDTDLGLPLFSEISSALTDRFYKEARIHIFEIEGVVLSERKGENISELIVYLRKRLPTKMRNLTTLAIQTYFADPKVIKILRNSEPSLFPYPRALPEINFELLEPVIELYREG